MASLPLRGVVVDLFADWLFGRSSGLLWTAWLCSVSSLSTQAPSFKTIAAIQLDLLFERLHVVSIVHLAILHVN
jgi:hypothetical protein